jgi:hypothetical protein
MASETRSRTETYTEMVPVVTAQVQTYTVMVPYTETRTGTRKVARVVQVVVPQTVTRDMGHFEDRCVTQTVFAASAASSCSGSSRCGLFSRRRGGCHSSGCGNDCGDACGNGCGTSCVADCGPQISTVTQRVWVPNLVTVTENVTVSKIEYVDEPFSYTVNLCRAETRQQTVNVTTYQAVARSREVAFTVCVPKTMTGTQTVTSFRTETYQETVNTTVCVPVQVQKQVAVQVCRMVPRTIQVAVKVPVAISCAPLAGNGCGADCGGALAGGCGSDCGGALVGGCGSPCR